jgi:hypothetical protein
MVLVRLRWLLSRRLFLGGRLRRRRMMLMRLRQGAGGVAYERGSDEER